MIVTGGFVRGSYNDRLMSVKWDAEFAVSSQISMSLRDVAFLLLHSADSAAFFVEFRIFYR